jgi:drug/metabolite transporter (DMT)-like permease
MTIILNHVTSWLRQGVSDFRTAASFNAAPAVLAANTAGTSTSATAPHTPNDAINALGCRADNNHPACAGAGCGTDAGCAGSPRVECQRADTVAAGEPSYTIGELVIIFVAALCLVSAGAAKIILMNKLLAAFPSVAAGTASEPVGGPFTLIVGTMTALVFLYVMLLLLAVVIRPATRRYFTQVVFSCRGAPVLPQGAQRRAWGGVLAFSVFSAINGVLLAYGTRNTPVLVQSMILSTQLVFLVLFSALFKLGGTRSYCNLMVITALVLSISGVGVGTIGATSAAKTSDTTVAWIFVLIGGVVAAALAGVAIAVFFRFALPRRGGGVVAPDRGAGALAASGCCAGDDGPNAGDNDDDGPLRPLLPQPRTAATTDYATTPNDDTSAMSLQAVYNDGTAVAARTSGPAAKQRTTTDGGGDQLGANLWMLVFGNGIMTGLCFCFFPLDWAPFFGMYPRDAASSRLALSNGMRCLYNGYPGCEEAANVFRAFVAVVIVGTTSGTIMSRFSPPLSGLLGQVSSPLCAIVLVIFPSLNAHPSTVNVGHSVGALILIASGAIIFALWERMRNGGAAASPRTTTTSVTVPTEVVVSM